MIPKETVDRILDSAQIVDVVGDFVTLKRRGANYTACCPFHNEKTPSFYVSPSKGIFKCFGCGKSGTAVGFVMEHENLSYADALKFLAKKYNIEVVEKEETAEDIALRQRGESLLLVSEFACKFFRENLATEEGRAIGYNYFKSRGLEDATIEKFGLGWAPLKRTALAEAAKKAGYKEEYLTDTGLCYKKDDGTLVDRFFDRVMFPIHSPSGRIIAFGGRTLKNDKSVAKYVNSPETEIYVKSKSLYGIYFARNGISRADKCFLVEGYLDVISMHQLGITNVVASSGTSLTVEQIRLIKKFTNNVTIIYDGDSAGIHAALRGIDLVLKEGLDVKVVLLPDGDDPDSYSRKHTLAEVEEFIASHEQDFIGFKSDLLLGEAGSDPLKKANLINDIADTVALIPDAVKRSVYVETCSRKFNIEQNLLFERISRTRGGILAAAKPAAEGKAPAVEVVEPGDDAVLEDRWLAPCEKELLGFILEYGHKKLLFANDSEYYAAGEEPPTVADFIDSALSEDEVVFANSLYRKIYEMYFSLYAAGLESGQICQRLMNDSDPEVARTAADILVEKYDLTVENYRKALTSETTMLVQYVPRAVLAYQVRLVDKMIREMSEKLNGLSAGGTDEMIGVLAEINELNRIKTIINNKLGRV